MYAAVKHEDKSGLYCPPCNVLDESRRYEVVCTEVKLGSLGLIVALTSFVYLALVKIVYIGLIQAKVAFGLSPLL